MSFLDRWFKRRKDPPASTDPSRSSGLEVSADGAGTLAALFQSYGLETRIEDIFVHLPQYGARAAARLSWPSPTICQVEVWLKLADGQLINDACAGRGSDPDEAEKEAWENFVWGDFHVLLSGVLRVPGADGDVEIEEWVIRGRRYRVVIGSMQYRGFDPNGGLDRMWRPALRAAIEEAGVGRGSNWVSFFYCQIDAGRSEVEVELNNEPWPAVARRMLALPWPQPEGYHSVRLFLSLSELDG